MIKTTVDLSDILTNILNSTNSPNYRIKKFSKVVNTYKNLYDFNKAENVKADIQEGIFNLFKELPFKKNQDKYLFDLSFAINNLIYCSGIFTNNTPDELYYLNKVLEEGGFPKNLSFPSTTINHRLYTYINCTTVESFLYMGRLHMHYTTFNSNHPLAPYEILDYYMDMIDSNKKMNHNQKLRQYLSVIYYYIFHGLYPINEAIKKEIYDKKYDEVKERFDMLFPEIREEFGCLSDKLLALLSSLVKFCNYGPYSNGIGLIKDENYIIELGKQPIKTLLLTMMDSKDLEVKDEVGYGYNIDSFTNNFELNLIENMESNNKEEYFYKINLFYKDLDIKSHLDFIVENVLDIEQFLFMFSYNFLFMEFGGSIVELENTYSKIIDVMYEITKVGLQYFSKYKRNRKKIIHTKNTLERYSKNDKMKYLMKNAIDEYLGNSNPYIVNLKSDILQDSLNKDSQG